VIILRRNWWPWRGGRRYGSRNADKRWNKTEALLLSPISASNSLRDKVLRSQNRCALPGGDRTTWRQRPWYEADKEAEAVNNYRPAQKWAMTLSVSKVTWRPIDRRGDGTNYALMSCVVALYNNSAEFFSSSVIR